MAVFPPLKPGKNKRPSLKGTLMVDVSQGAERMRAWPPKRGKNLPDKTKEQMEWFRQAQWACKYMAPEIMQSFARATKGTPFLPRDIATMMFAGRFVNFIFADNTRLSSVQTITDVSESLDVFGTTEGMTLRRGPQFWEAVAPVSTTVVGAIITRPATTATFANNTFGTITWTTEQLDQAAFWDVALPNRVTVARDGWYSLFAIAQRIQTTNFGGDIRLMKNGNEIVRNRWLNTNGYSGANPMISMIDYAVAGDYYEVQVACYGATHSYNNCQLRICGPL